MLKFARETVPILSADETYALYRIPGICVTKKGTVLIWYEARRERNDWASMDIILERSEDGGKTFCDRLLLARGDEIHPTVNNPTVTVGSDGRLHFLFCRDYTVDGGGVWYAYSDDDGKSFSAPRDISAGLLPDYHNCLAIGPGHGIEIVRNGEKTLLFPAWLVPKEFGADLKSHQPSVVTTVFSRDNGRSWQMGEIIPATEEVQTPNETTAAQLADGTVLLNMRCTPPCRAVTRSKNGYSGWSKPELDRNLTDPGCFGSSVAVGGGKRLFFVNCESETERKNLVLKSSTDGGKRFDEIFTVDAGDAGYADIAADEKNGLLYIFYEKNYGATDCLAVIKYQ